MVALTWAALMAAAAAAVAIGRPEVAVALGGAKALLVGWTFLELRHAAWAHAVVWGVVVTALTAALAGAV